MVGSHCFAAINQTAVHSVDSLARLTNSDSKMAVKVAEKLV